MIDGREQEHEPNTSAGAVPHGVVVVVPAFREPTVVGQVVTGLQNTGCVVVVVDDGSGDGTGGAARNAGAVVLRHAVNLGQGAALVTGLRYALAHLEPRCIVTFDADGQHDPADLAALVSPILEGRADVALGSRFGGGSAPGIPPLRRIALQTAARFSRFAHGIRLTDSHNGLRAMAPHAARAVVETMRQPRMAHASEFISVVHRAKLRIVEVPVTVRYSAYSLAKGQHLRHAFVVIWDLLLARMLRQ